VGARVDAFNVVVIQDRGACASGGDQALRRTPIPASLFMCLSRAMCLEKQAGVPRGCLQLGAFAGLAIVGLPLAAWTLPTLLKASGSKWAGAWVHSIL